MTTNGTANDGDLLRAFVNRGDQASFTALVERHMAMVLSVGELVLRNRQEAEETVQATFMVLAKKAGALTGCESVAGWLNRVSHDTAVDMLRSRVARQKREQEAVNMAEQTCQDPAGDDALRAMLSDELSALPEKLRQALTLFYFEGQTIQQIASVLDCSEHNVAVRLNRGRDRLRKRMVSRGVVVPLASLAGLLSVEAWAGTVPAGFVAATSETAILFAAGKTAAVVGATGSSTVASIAEGVLKIMFWNQVKVAVMVAVAIGLLGGGGITAAKLLAEDLKKPDAGAIETKKSGTVAEKLNESNTVNGLRFTISADKLEADAGDKVNIAVSFENVSVEAFRIYTRDAETLRWELVAPDNVSLMPAPTVMKDIMPSPPRVNEFPEVKAGGKYEEKGNAIGGNPPICSVGGPYYDPFNIYLIKPGTYKLTAVYSNKVDSCWPSDKPIIREEMPWNERQDVPGKVWKGAIRSNTLEIKFGGKFEVPKSLGPWPVKWPEQGIDGATPPQKGQKITGISAGR